MIKMYIQKLALNTEPYRALYKIYFLKNLGATRDAPNFFDLYYGFVIICIEIDYLLTLKNIGTAGET